MDERGVDTEDVTDPFRRQNLAWRPVGDDLAGI
jgi:hypothetical protein